MPEYAQNAASSDTRKGAVTKRARADCQDHDTSHTSGTGHKGPQETRQGQAKGTSQPEQTSDDQQERNTQEAGHATKQQQQTRNKWRYSESHECSL